MPVSAILAANLSVIRSRWSSLASKIENAPDLSFFADGEAYIINGIHLSSSIDGERDIKSQISFIGDEWKNSKVIWCYGIGNGRLPWRLLTEFPGHKIVVVIMNYSVTKTVLSSYVLPLDNPRLHLMHAEDLSKGYGPFVASSPDLRLSEPSAHHIRDRIMAAINTPFNLMRFNSRQEQDSVRLKQNEFYISQDKEVSQEIGKAKGYEAIVVAGGPSIDRYYDKIKSMPLGPIICATTSFMPLCRSGIIPHYTLIIDQADVMVQHFQGMEEEKLQNTSLVYETVISTDILAFWCGKRLVNTTLWSAGTVAHACVDLAVKMGCSAIHLFGFDFCYPEGRSHLAGAPEPYSADGAWRLHAIDGYGRSVKTDNALTQYHRCLEDYIEEHPDVRFIKYGREGVGIKGATWADD